MEEKDHLMNEIRKLKIIESDKHAKSRLEKDLLKLGKRLCSQLMNMGMADKQKLIEYFIPAGSFVEVLWLHPDDYHKMELSSKRKIDIKWSYRYKGVFDLNAVVSALKSYQNTKKIPNYASYLSFKGIG